MTGSGVERMPLSAFRDSSPVAPTLMPRPSQGAERGRMTRWGMRALVIGGLAGAAWLLTGTAARAADHDHPPLGGSLVGALVGDRTVEPVTRILTTAAKPLESERPAHRHHATTSVLDVPARILAKPVEALTGTVDAASGEDTAVGGAVRAIAAPLRLTGGPAKPKATPAAQPAVEAEPAEVEPATVEPAVAEPAVVEPAVVEPAVVEPVADEPAVVEPVAPEPAKVARVEQIEVMPAEVEQAPAVRSVPVVDRDGTDRHVSPADGSRSVAADRHHPAVVAAAGPETARKGTPGGDGPAPLQVHLGAVSGIPTSASGSPAEGGSAAFLPAAVANSSTAHHRLPIAADVEVRRFDAEAPTVSPD